MNNKDDRYYLYHSYQEEARKGQFYIAITCGWLILGLLGLAIYLFW